MRRWLVWTGALLASAWCVLPAGAASRVLFRAGRTARGGPPLVDPYALGTDGRRVAFLGTSEAILVFDGNSYTVAARSGDAVPPPDVGVFGSLSHPIINDAGQVLFTARGVRGPPGLYLWSAGTIAKLTGTRSMASDLNDAGQVAFSIRRDRVYLVSGGDTVELARAGPLPSRGRIRRLRDELVLSDDGSVAFQALVIVAQGGRTRGREAILVVSAGAAPTLVAVEGDPSPTGDAYSFGSRIPLSINASGQIAFVSGGPSGGVFVYQPAAATTATVARAGDLVDGEALTGFGDFVGIDSHGKVAFEGRFGDGVTAVTRLVLASGGALTVLADEGRVVAPTTFAPRLADTGDMARVQLGRVDRLNGATVTPVGGPETRTPFGRGFLAGDPSINATGAVAFRSHQSGVYALAHGAAKPVLLEGETTETGGVLSSIFAFALGRRRVAALCSEDDAGLVLAARAAGGPLIDLARAGDPSPLGGTFDFADDPPRLARRGVVFAAEIFEGDAPAGILRANFEGRRLEVIARAGMQLEDGSVLEDVSSPAPLAHGVAFQATLEGATGTQGLFVARRGRIRKIAVTGDPAPGGGRFRDFARPVADRRHVLFAATIGQTGGDDTSGLFLWSRRGGLVRAVALGTRVRGGGHLGRPGDGTLLYTYAVRGGTIAFTGPFVTGGGATDAVFLRRRGRPRRLLTVGDTTALGTLQSLGDLIVARGKVVVGWMGVVDGGSPTAIVAVEP